MSDSCSGGSSPVVLTVFLLGGLAAFWCGVSWAFDVRGITTRRSERIRRKNEESWAAMGRLDGSPTIFAPRLSPVLGRADDVHRPAPVPVKADE